VEVGNAAGKIRKALQRSSFVNRDYLKIMIQRRNRTPNAGYRCVTGQAIDLRGRRENRELLTEHKAGW
jgi:hypothetical protein